jgi:hypothetical protein
MLEREEATRVSLGEGNAGPFSAQRPSTEARGRP